MSHASAKLIFNIETVGYDFDSFDDLTKDILACDLHERCDGGLIRKEGVGRSQLSIYPLMGEIISIGVFDLSRNNGAVYFYGGKTEGEETHEEKGIKMRPQATEKEILEHFWDVAGHYTEFISFNGRKLDVPFLLLRSAIREVRATKDLMSDRKLVNQRFDALHVDICDQMTFYGSLEQPGNLHVWCKAFGIDTPDTAEVDDIHRAFEEKRYNDIARRTVANLLAMSALYERWNTFLRF